MVLLRQPRPGGLFVRVFRTRTTPSSNSTAADKAWALTPVLGFRTFVKTAARGGAALYEPFAKPRPDAGGAPAFQRMAIEPGVLTLTDRCEALGLEIRARTFTVPGEPYAALARELSVANTGRRRLEIELLDGLPRSAPTACTRICSRT